MKKRELLLDYGYVYPETVDEAEILWEDFKNELTDLMKERTFWRDDAKDMGWLLREGYKVFKAENGLEFLRAISPDTDCSYQFFRYRRNWFLVRLSHHDAPTGEWHIIRPTTEKAYEEYKEDNY